MHELENTLSFLSVIFNFTAHHLLKDKNLQEK